jgi:RNA polymerase sigma-B factor
VPQTLTRTRAGDRASRQRQDHRLALRQQRGEPGARRELIERYMPLARSLALRYRRASEPLDDLIQVASVGLVKAVDRWDPGRGLAFSSYAVPTILGELRRYFRDSTWDVRPARDMQELCLAVEEARDALWVDLGRSPTVADLAKHLDRPPEQVMEALQASDGRSLRSLDAPVHEDEGDSASAGDLIGDHDPGYARVEAVATIEQMTAILDDRAREILRLRFEEDMLQSEIAAHVGCSQMHVSRIIRSSLERLYAYGRG